MQKSPFIQNNVGVRSRDRLLYHQNHHSARQAERTQQVSLKGDPKSRSSHLEPRQLSQHSKYDDDPSPHQQQRRQTTDILPQASGVSENSTKLKDSKVRLSQNGTSKYERTLEDSRKRLLRSNFQNEPDVSLRQSNVMRSPRVYNYTSAKLQNETPKPKDLAVNPRKGKIQQVTVGPTESDSICEIYFQPHNSTVKRPSHEFTRLPERRFVKGLHEPSPWKQKSHSNNFYREHHDPSTWEPKSHFEAFHKPYFESYSDTKVPASTTDVTIENERLPRHLVSTQSTEIQSSRPDAKKYVRNTTKDNGLACHRLHQNSSAPVPTYGRGTTSTSHRLASVKDDEHISSRDKSMPTYYNPSARRVSHQFPSTTDNEYFSSRSKENSRSRTRPSYSGVKPLTPSYYAQYLHNRTMLNNRSRTQMPRSTTGYQRKSQWNSRSESSKYHQRAPDNFDALAKYRDDTVPRFSSSHDYYVNQSNKIPSSNDFNRSDISLSQFESTNHSSDYFSSDYDATIIDADREHYLNQQVLRKIDESNALHNESRKERHLVGSNYDSSTIETTSDGSYDFLSQDQSSDQISLSDSDSSSESLHVSELDTGSNPSDNEIISSPVKSSLKSKPKPPSLMGDFKLYHKMGPVKQVHFKEPISVAATISNITLEELGMTSESSDHDVTVVELEDDYSDHSMIPSSKHDKISTELEKKRIQDAGNTPKITRTKRSVNREMISSELENKPSLIQSFEESTLNPESENSICENCNRSRKENSSSRDSDTLKISQGTNTELHSITNSEAQPQDRYSGHGSFKKTDADTAAKSNGFPSNMTSKKLFCRPDFETHCHDDGESFSQNEKEQHPSLTSTDSSDTHQSKKALKANVKGHHHSDRMIFKGNEVQRRSSSTTEASPVAVTSQRKGPSSEHSSVSSLGNEAASSLDDTVIVHEAPSGFQGMLIRSPNPPTCSHQSKDYRMMRLQAVIDCSPPKERKNIIIKARYFRRWKDNVRLLTRIKKKEHRKLMRAEVFHRITALAKHFFSWRDLILEQQIKADEFHYRCVLKKGMSALRWAAMNRRIQTNRAQLGRQKFKLNSCFRKWRMRLERDRICRLHKLFFHWRRRLHENLLVAKFESNRRHATQHQVFEIWHKRFVNSMQVRISGHHYNLVLTQKIWNTWRVYTADELVKVSQREVSEVKSEFRLLAKNFTMWKKMTQQKLSFQWFKNRKIMASCLQKWRHFADVESLRRQKELNIARQTRRRNLLSQYFHGWTLQLRLLNFKKNRHNNTMRYCLLMWRSQMDRHQVIHAEIMAHHDLVQKKHGMSAFKQNAANEKELRQIALRELKHRILQRHLKHWHFVVAQKSKLRDMQDTFQACSIKNHKQVIFTKWKDQVEDILKVRQANMQWSMTCVAKAACKWLRKLQLKQMTKLCDRKITAKNMSLLQNCLHIWRIELRQIVKQNKRVNEAERHLVRGKLQNYLHRWHLKSCEAALIRPLVNALKEKRISRHFNSWLLYVRRKNSMQSYRKKINRQTAKGCFTEWKRRVHHIESFRRAEQEYDRILMRRGLKAWIRFSNRWRCCIRLSSQRKELVLCQYFSTWATKTEFRRIEETVKQHDDAIKRENAQKLLTRWKGEATKRRESVNLLLCHFTEKLNLSSKRTTFNYWRTALENIQTAKSYASKIAKDRLKELLQEWHNVAEASIQAQLSNFTLSMMSQQKQNLKTKELYPDWTVRSDITETDSMNGNQYSDQESNDCFETKSEMISLREIVNNLHSNGLKIAPLETNQNVFVPQIASNSAFHELRHLEMIKQSNCCGDSGILSKDVTTATPSENDDSSISSSQESFNSREKDMPSNKTLTVEHLAKSQDSNMGSSVMEDNNGGVNPAIEDSPESVSSLSSGCSDDPTLSSSTVSQPQSDDPFLRPILSDLSHLAALPIDRTYKWMHKFEETKDSLKSVKHDIESMAQVLEQENPKPIVLENSSHEDGDIIESVNRDSIHDNINSADDAVKQENLEQLVSENSSHKGGANMAHGLQKQGHHKQSISTQSTYAVNHTMDEENSLICLPSPMNQSGSDSSPAYFTPKCTPTQHTSSQPMPEMVPSTAACEYPISPESLTDMSNIGNNPFSPAKFYYDSAEFGNVESSVLLALSHPATHISDLSSPLYFTPDCTPPRYKSPYPSGVPLLSPLQNSESKQNLDIVTKQMELNFSQSNCPNQEFVLQSDDIQSVVVHSPNRDGLLEESDDSRSLTSSDESQGSSWQRVERSTEDSYSESDSMDDLSAVSKPMHIALQNSGVSTTEWLVHFALVRLRHRPVAFAFHQWRMLIRMKQWKQEMKSHASKISTRFRLKEYFRIWKSVTSQKRIAKHHYYITTMKRYFSTIRAYAQYRVEQRSILSRALFQKNRQVLAKYFRCWQKKFQQKTALLEILQYWQSKVRTGNPSNHREARIQIERNHDIVAECFYHWKIKIQQVKKVDKYHNEALMSRCIVSWKIWARNRGFRREKAAGFYSMKLKMKVFQALKEYTSLSQTVKQHEIENERNFMSALLNQWHGLAKNSSHQRSTFYKLSVRRTFKTKALCFNNWRCEMLKRKIAGVMYRRTLMKKMLHSWKEAVDFETYEKRSCRKIQGLVDGHLKEAVLEKWLDEVLMKSKVNSLKQKHLYVTIVQCWDTWTEKVALKKSDNLYENFLKKRYFHQWVSILSTKREQNEKIRAVLRRWHAISSRSKKLTGMADQFRLKSNNLITDLTFNLWLIAREQSQKSGLHWEQKITSGLFHAWQSWTRKKRTLQRTADNYLQYRAKERFAIAWHTWIHRYRVRLTNVKGIILHQKAAAIRTLRFHWLAWQRKKLENDSSKFYRNKLLHYATQTWLVQLENAKRADRLCEDHSSRKLHKVLLAWRGLVISAKSERTIVTELNKSRRQIITMTTFVTWLKAYKNNKLAASCYERILKRRGFASLTSWKRKRKDLRNSYNHIVHIVDVTMLSSCLSQWKSLYRKSRMMQVSCDQMLELKETELQRKSWQAWFRAKEKRDIKKMHLHNLVLDAAKKWRTYAINRANKRRIKEERVVMAKRFKHKWLCKTYFSYWCLEHKGNQLNDIFQTRFTQRFWNIWTERTASSICAVSISRHQMLYSFWRIWRLEFVMSKAVEESTRERSRDYLKLVFKAWRSLIVQAKTGVPEYQRIQSPRGNSTPRKSRIPILSK